MIHRTGDIWLKPDEKRFMMLSVRYISSDQCAEERPENDKHKIVLVEYDDADASEVIQRLGLTCVGR